jgi:hypothetical protein
MIDKLKIVQLAKDIMLNREKYHIDFMCVAIERAAIILECSEDSQKGPDVIPEMLKYKPDGTKTNSPWFLVNEDGFKQRIEILDKLIEEFKKC